MVLLGDVSSEWPEEPSIRVTCTFQYRETAVQPDRVIASHLVRTRSFTKFVLIFVPSGPDIKCALDPGRHDAYATEALK